MVDHNRLSGHCGVVIVNEYQSGPSTADRQLQSAARNPCRYNKQRLESMRGINKTKSHLNIASSGSCGQFDHGVVFSSCCSRLLVSSTR